MGPRACVPRVSKRVSTRSSRMRFLLVGLIVCVAIASASDFDGTMGYSVEERLADGETERAERRVGLTEEEHGSCSASIQWYVPRAGARRTAGVDSNDG